jgi:hypothetical protein
MMSHYAGSFTYDNDEGEMSDWVVTRYEWDDLVKDIKHLMTKRKNSEVFFAVYVNKFGEEKDLTKKLKKAING